MKKQQQQVCMIMIIGVVACSLVGVALAVPPPPLNFNNDVQMYFGNHLGQVQDNGNTMALNLDQQTGSGFNTKNEYLFGRFDMQMKLVKGFSAGTVTTFYLTSPIGQAHDEVDFEFLGNATFQPYTVHTNVFADGKGDREQQFHLWFDPTAAYHDYTIIWNSQRIVWLVDNVPIRVYENHENVGVPFPKSKPMKVFCSLWEASDWATQGGDVKVDWSKAPFTAYYKNFVIDGCVGTSSCADSKPWGKYALDADANNKLQGVRTKNRVYNYCTDNKRFGGNPPAECKPAGPQPK
ncbi:PREDICTED: xyloglucan endotransglucosylase/hydrolase protein 24-like [Ipomoea nil]|uniref:xyloglucan endotransglucosylase/hydrolase protein 24-like n=1 Tax=Ipomoea nil TaxID=35883 RepID=UPI000900B15F|nr:PREDICTED: xyloglucan endotransglucosylase/hydrolase protein 24-like [Ipomoea nil]XP_019150101.1 PREDICTED: xyloglucan endotransglucosylase/hydrolase protein 24-like [Ipomoea nil]XP_019150107.1 PREDICTED: xyloglucan endotransglucosylase/hydrolase protein 24-like [Ipomoea nil]